MTLSLAAIQMSMSDSRDDNVAKAERLVRQAASAGAKIILIPELFSNPVFEGEISVCKNTLLLLDDAILISFSPA